MPTSTRPFPTWRTRRSSSASTFEAGEGIHLEPLGVFSNKHKSLDELPDGGTIGIINDTANQSRALELLATQGLVSIPEGGGDVNINTITKLKNFNFREVEGPQLVRSLDDFAAAVSHAGEARYPIHLKLDTGMHRLGFMEEEIGRLCEVLPTRPEVKVASVFSHLNCADMPEEDAYTRAQIARFDRMSGAVAASLPYPVLRHTANSAAIERFPEAQYDMCRLGLGFTASAGGTTTPCGPSRRSERGSCRSGVWPRARRWATAGPDA